MDAGRAAFLLRNPHRSKESLRAASRNPVGRGRGRRGTGDIDIRPIDIRGALQLGGSTRGRIGPKHLYLMIGLNHGQGRRRWEKAYHLDIINVNGGLRAITKLRSNVRTALCGNLDLELVNA